MKSNRNNTDTTGAVGILVIAILVLGLTLAKKDKRGQRKNLQNRKSQQKFSELQRTIFQPGFSVTHDLKDDSPSRPTAKN